MYILDVKKTRKEFDVTKETPKELEDNVKKKKFNPLYLFPIAIGVVTIAVLISIIVGASL